MSSENCTQTLPMVGTDVANSTSTLGGSSAEVLVFKITAAASVYIMRCANRVHL
jgi:hypothetical protein